MRASFFWICEQSFQGGGRSENNVPSRRKCLTAYGDRGSCVRKCHTNCVSMGETSVAFKLGTVRFGNPAIQNERWWLSWQVDAKPPRNRDSHLTRDALPLSSCTTFSHAGSLWTMDFGVRALEVLQSCNILGSLFLGGRRGMLSPIESTT